LTKINSVVVLGAGAMGASYASRLYDMDRSCVSFVASGDRYQQLKNEGLVVNNQHYLIPVIAAEDHSHPADLIIVALKQPYLERALQDLNYLVDDNTIFLSIMNGLDSEPVIGSVFGSEKVLLATAVGIDAQRHGNVIHYSKGGTIYFGEADNTSLTERVKAIQAFFDRTGIAYKTPVDMLHIMWWKFMINVGINQASAVLSAPYGIFQASSHAQQIMESAMREVISVGAPEGINLTAEDIQKWYTFMNSLDPAGKTSMLQDIEAGRPTEVDIFGGKVIELGKKHNIPTPYNELLYNAIKVLEQHKPDSGGKR
jgi:2-dehydropantoate 2-reductase